MTSVLRHRQVGVWWLLSNVKRAPMPAVAATSWWPAVRAEAIRMAQVGAMRLEFSATFCLKALAVSIQAS